MIVPEVLFCLDSESVKHPGLVGLGDEKLESLPWIRVCSNALEARSLAKESNSPKEVWIASSDDMDAINLAAAIKVEAKDKPVMLIAAQPTGSMMSRARMAGIEAVLDERAFAQHYAKTKHAYSSGQNHPEGGKLATSILVLSASGGVGKSTVSALAASMTAAAGLRTLLVDADLQYGSTSSLLKDAKEISSADILTDLNTLPSAIDEHVITVTTAPARLEQAESLSCELPTLLDLASTLFDVVVVDAGPFWDDTQLALMERCTKTIFVIDQRASSIKSCKRAIDLLIRCGMATGPIRFALNRCSKTAPYSSMDLACALHGATVFELKDGGREVEELMSVGMAESLIAAQNPLAESLEKLLSDCLPALPPASKQDQRKRSNGSLLDALRSPSPVRKSRKKELQ
ncbi:MAG: P-loop NTPase [Eggerthellaceae bacterium]|nr:P-loop NTPase [Eggerthellaceae bacterium]